MAAPALTALVSSITNNNGARARQAAVAEKAAAEKAEAGARTAQAAKGWTERTMNGATVVTFLPSKRSRKAAKLPDGSDVLRAGTKAMQTPDASEMALLARAAGKKATAKPAKTAVKRKAAETQAAPSRKK
jgi:hypothetical protein